MTTKQQAVSNFVAAMMQKQSEAQEEALRHTLSRVYSPEVIDTLTFCALTLSPEKQVQAQKALAVLGKSINLRIEVNQMNPHDWEVKYDDPEDSNERVVVRNQ